MAQGLSSDIYKHYLNFYTKQLRTLNRLKRLLCHAVIFISRDVEGIEDKDEKT